jgi:hypothetical protein
LQYLTHGGCTFLFSHQPGTANRSLCTSNFPINSTLM